MSKTTKKDLGSDTAKTVIEQAKREVPNFGEHYQKFDPQSMPEMQTVDPQYS